MCSICGKAIVNAGILVPFPTLWRGRDAHLECAIPIRPLMDWFTKQAVPKGREDDVHAALVMLIEEKIQRLFSDFLVSHHVNDLLELYKRFLPLAIRKVFGRRDDGMRIVRFADEKYTQFGQDEFRREFRREFREEPFRGEPKKEFNDRFHADYDLSEIAIDQVTWLSAHEARILGDYETDTIPHCNLSRTILWSTRPDVWPRIEFEGGFYKANAQFRNETKIDTKVTGWTITTNTTQCKWIVLATHRVVMTGNRCIWDMIRKIIGHSHPFMQLFPNGDGEYILQVPKQARALGLLEIHFGTEVTAGPTISWLGKRDLPIESIIKVEKHKARGTKDAVNIDLGSEGFKSVALPMVHSDRRPAPPNDSRIAPLPHTRAPATFRH